MASNFKPAAGMITVVRGYSDVKKINLSTYPRQFKSGSMLWLNKVSGRYQAEPANISATNAGTDFASATTNAGDATSLAHCQGVFAPLFLGIAAGARIAQQLSSTGQFGAVGNATSAVMDASKPFEGFYDEGIAKMPVGPTTSSTGLLTAAVEVGTLIAPDGFENNDGAIGFYDDAGAKHNTESLWYLYDNCVTTTSDGNTAITAANAIGVVVERGEIGSPILLVKFRSPVFGLGKTNGI